MNRRRNRTLRNSLILTAGAAAAFWLWQRQTEADLLDGQTALITGSSRGLGLQLAREFACAGCRVVLCARDPHELEQARVALRMEGADVMAIPCDVSDRAQVEQMVREATEHFGGIDILVNNAGVIQVGPYRSLTVEDFEEALGVMYWGVLYPTLAVLPQMEARGYGRIVNVTSIGGRVSVPHLLPYSSAKFAAVGLSEGLGAELAAKGIYVTTVVPGLMRTGSYLNADFKGDQVNEFTWFSLGASLPLISMDAEKAARQVVLATRRRATTVTLSLPALLLERFHGLFPGATIQISRLAERLLLPDTERTTTEHMRGMTAQAHMPDTRRQVHRTLTQLGQQAAERFHQYDGGRGGRNPATDPEVGGLPRATKPPRYNAQE